MPTTDAHLTNRYDHDSRAIRQAEFADSAWEAAGSDVTQGQSQGVAKRLKLMTVLETARNSQE